MKILGFAGSARTDSFNVKLLNIAARILADAAVEVDIFDFRQYPLPLYDGDLEASEGMPDNAKRFKAALVACDGFLIASPEYNSAYSPLLKNAIDWASRATSADDTPLQAFSNKTAVLIATSPGALGGLRGLSVLKTLLGNIRVHVLPNQLAIPRAHEVFENAGQLNDSLVAENLEQLMAEFVDFTQKLAR
ncbi:MAG: NAD(P)H-dependent oxidoreductase [Pseudomonadota bacterium]